MQGGKARLATGCGTYSSGYLPSNACCCSCSTCPPFTPPSPPPLPSPQLLVEVLGSKASTAAALDQVRELLLCAANAACLAAACDALDAYTLALARSGGGGGGGSAAGGGGTNDASSSGPDQVSCHGRSFWPGPGPCVDMKGWGKGMKGAITPPCVRVSCLMCLGGTCCRWPCRQHTCMLVLSWRRHVDGSSGPMQSSRVHHSRVRHVPWP